MEELEHIFIPSYHRPENLKTVYYFVKGGYPADKIHVVIDSEADDYDVYERESERIGFNLHVFDMEEARSRYDYVHRASVSRRSAGQARNMFYEIAEELGITRYVVQDDDTCSYDLRPFVALHKKAKVMDVAMVFKKLADIMEKHHIGMFGLSQSGDLIGGEVDTKLIRNKVMNTTFINTKYMYRGERGVQDDDTSQFATAMNEGYFTGSLRSGLILRQTASATAKGGLTDLYNECKLLNKAMVTPIQFPSAIHAERQEKNGGRLHHRIKSRYLYPKIMKGKRSNIEWDAYPEDVPFTNEPNNRKRL